MDLAFKLDKLRKEHLFRLRNINSEAQHIEPIINGQKVLSFCSNDYLGLANHPKIIAALIKGANNYGVGSGASHLITGHHHSHYLLEEELADFIGCEKTLLFSTGYMANLGVVNALADRNTVIFQDRLNHASLIDAGVLSRARVFRYKHLHIDELDKKILAAKNKPKLILSDGVFSMDGTVAPVNKLQSVSKQYDATLVIDDAHGIGVLGDKGKGCTEGLLKPETILIGTLGKAFGTFGAFVAANQDTVEWLIQRARTYIYTTALPPSLAEATRVSLQLIYNESWRREKLVTLVKHFRELCEQSSIALSASSTPIQPIIIGTAELAIKVSEALLAKGILVSAIRPPTVKEGTARLRISFSATHNEAHVERLVAALNQTMNKYCK